MKNIILLTKDAMCKSYLPIYGNRYWRGQTPNIDWLAQNGNVFTNCYTTAPSTAMAFLGLCIGTFSYQLDNKKYEHIKTKYKHTIFDIASERGFESHIVWDTRWLHLAKPYSECYGNAIFHCIDGLGQPVGSQYPHKGDLKVDDSKTILMMNKLEHELEDISKTNYNKFIWIHLPHVLMGRTCYGGDIDILDRIVGFLLDKFPDSDFYLSADHGNMNGHKNKLGYGFDVYNTAVQIPLITTKFPQFSSQIVDYNISIIDFSKLMFDRTVPNRDYIYCDSAYYAQLHRKLAIIKGHYKYIYNKQTKTEEFYDLSEDPNEECNLINDKPYDFDRHFYTPLKELYFKSDWNDIIKVREELRAEKNKIWRQEKLIEGIWMRIKSILGSMYTKYNVLKRKYKKGSCDN